MIDIYNERIRPLFQLSGLTDKDLEKALGLPRGVIYKWGTGKYKSYKSYLPQIAAYFHVSTDYLLGHTDDPRPPAELTGKEQQNKTVPPEEDGPEDAETRELRAIWDTADEDERRALLEMARLIKARRPKPPSAPEG